MNDSPARTNGTDTVVAGSIPELYEKYMVPMLFEPYAVDLVRRLAAVRRFGTGRIDGLIQAHVVSISSDAR